MPPGAARLEDRVAPTLPPPRAVTARALVQGLARAERVIGPAGLVLSMGVVLEIGLRRGDLVSMLPVFATLAGLLAVALVHALRPSIATAVAMLVLGLPLVAASTAAVVTLLAPLEAHGAYLVEAGAAALVFVGAVRPTAADGIGWTAAGYAVGTLGATAGQLVSGVAVALSWDRATDAAILALGYAIIAVGRRRARSADVAVPVIERETRDAHRRRLRERAAAAVVHDTVLATLTLIARAENGAVDERLRRSIPRDIETIEATVATARGARGAVTPPDDLLAPRLRDLAEQSRWRGLRVDVTGADALPSGIEPDVVDAIAGAVAAALENVIQHAGVDRADVMIGVADEQLTVLVGDAGGGFDPEQLPADRLGMRQAIRGRIERVGGSVRVWSGGAGTTVLMSVPLALPSVAEGSS